MAANEPAHIGGARNGTGGVAVVYIAPVCANESAAFSHNHDFRCGIASMDDTGVPSDESSRIIKAFYRTSGVTVVYNARIHADHAAGGGSADDMLVFDAEAADGTIDADITKESYIILFGKIDMKPVNDMTLSVELSGKSAVGIVANRNESGTVIP